MSVKGPSLVVDVRSAIVEWHVWDGENRLIEIATKLSLGANTMGYDEGDQRLRFVYDYMGRRSEKSHEVHTSGNWVMQSGYPKWFIYDGWNVQLVLEPGSTYDPVTNPTDIVTERKYTWGLDLSGSFHGAGGIGGLLAAVETQGTSQTGDDVSYWYFYDANGNVGQLINGTTPGTPVLAAHYEYDPYGNLLAAVDVDSSNYVDINPFRYSTKWLDYEIGGTALGTTITGAVGPDGLYYYGFRHYSPRLGRWIKRDPIGEEGSLNLYQYVTNTPITNVDPFGLKKCTRWIDTIPRSEVSMTYRRWFIKGDIVLPVSRDGPLARVLGRWAHITHHIETEVDFEILTSWRIDINIAGRTGPTPIIDDSEGTLLTLSGYRWRLPTSYEVRPGAINTFTAKPFDLEGIGCRKLEACMRRCQRCCASYGYWSGRISTWDEVGCVFSGDAEHASMSEDEAATLGKKAQWRYGTVKIGWLGGYSCDLFPPGYLRGPNSQLFLQPEELPCEDSDVPSCKKAVCEKCFPSDRNWDGAPDARGVWR